jgi:hypothetical protein
VNEHGHAPNVHLPATGRSRGEFEEILVESNELQVFEGLGIVVLTPAYGSGLKTIRVCFEGVAGINPRRKYITLEN